MLTLDERCVPLWVGSLNVTTPNTPSKGLPVFCQACGKPWPADYSACPDDGSALVVSTLTATTSDVHQATTRVVPKHHLLEQARAIVGSPRVKTLGIVGAASAATAVGRSLLPFHATADPEHDTGLDQRSVFAESELTPIPSPDSGLDLTTLELRADAVDRIIGALESPTSMPFDVDTTLPGRNNSSANASALADGGGKLSIDGIAPERSPNSVDSSQQTRVVATRAPRAAKASKASKPSKSKSSDPPTVMVFTRRANRHIELPPGSVVDEYEINHRLGAGAMGEVYAARHVKLGKRVAIKLISPRLSQDEAAIERFEQEARTLAQMHHPGLVDVVGFGELSDGRAYFVMEYLSGESLYDRLARGRMDDNEALDVYDQMARALEAAHLHNVIHRDLKPENTFLVRVANEQRHIVKLLDFGLAKLAADVDRRAERTQSGVVIGTAMYLSPEQAHGPNVDHRTDIYALGCIGYEIFLGRPPFEDARTVAALIGAHLHEVPPMPRSVRGEIPPQLDLLLFAMLAKDPAYRPTLAQVRAVIAGVRSPALIPPTPVRQGGSARAMTAPLGQSARAKTLVIAGAAMIAGIVIGALALNSRAGGAMPTQVDSGIAPIIPLASTPEPAMAPIQAPVDAGITLIAPEPVDVGMARPHMASAPTRLPKREPIDADTPVVVADPVDAGMFEVAESSTIDAGVPTVAPIAIDAAVDPSRTTSPPTQRVSPPTATKKPVINRNQTINPFSKKPATR